MDGLINRQKVQGTRELHVAAGHSSKHWESAYHDYPAPAYSISSQVCTKDGSSFSYIFLLVLPFL